MLHITIQDPELFDEENSKFLPGESFNLVLEHSLVSVSKWEAKYEKPFLGTQEKTDEEALDYIRMMIIGEIPPPEIFAKLSPANIDAVNDHISAKKSATWFNDRYAKPTSEIITAEVIYYWMFSLAIPIEFETRHLNHLLTLVKVFQHKNAPEKKMSASEHLQMQRDLNRQRREQYGTKG